MSEHRGAFRRETLPMLLSRLLGGLLGIAYGSWRYAMFRTAGHAHDDIMSPWIWLLLGFAAGIGTGSAWRWRSVIGWLVAIALFVFVPGLTPL